MIENAGPDARPLRPSQVSTIMDWTNRRTTKTASSGRRPHRAPSPRSRTSRPHHPAPAQRRRNRSGPVPNRPWKPAVEGSRRGTVSSCLPSTCSTGCSVRTSATPPGTAERWGTDERRRYIRRHPTPIYTTPALPNRTVLQPRLQPIILPGSVVNRPVHTLTNA